MTGDVIHFGTLELEKLQRQGPYQLNASWYREEREAAIRQGFAVTARV